jgi:nucleotide-binding universal stress UspA family protein
MKNLLMAMDFSPSSINAYQHAASIAEKFGLSIVILWNETNDSLEHLKSVNGKTIPEKIQDKMSELNKSLEINGIETKIICTKGTTYKEIVRVADEEKSELIVVGHHGTHGVRRFLIGNNANKVIALAKCPVLTIQLHRNIKKELKKIVIAIDNTLDTRQKLPMTIEFALRFKAEVHVIGIYSSNVSTMKMRVDSYVKQAVSGLKNVGIETNLHFVNTSNISKTTINYANQIGANMIVTMVDTEYFTTDILLGSQGQQLVNQALIPVLSIHNKEFIKTRPGL